MILWIFESLTRWPTDPLKRSVIGSLGHWFVDSLFHWIIESLNHCFIDLHGLGTNYLVDNLIDGTSLNICWLAEKNPHPSMRRVQRPCLPNRFQGKSIPKITTLFCRMKVGDPVAHFSLQSTHEILIVRLGAPTIPCGLWGRWSWQHMT